MDEPINLGPKSDAILADVGVATLGDLHEIGVEEAFRRAKLAHSAVTLNLLWALEAAATGTSWMDVGPARKRELQRAVQDIL